MSAPGATAEQRLLILNCNLLQTQRLDFFALLVVLLLDPRDCRRPHLVECGAVGLEIFFDTLADPLLRVSERCKRRQDAVLERTDNCRARVKFCISEMSA